MIRLLTAVAIPVLVVGCADTASRADKSQPVQAEQPVARPPRNPPPIEKKPFQLPDVDEKDLAKPIRNWPDFPRNEYKKWPNCLDVFADCLVVPSKGTTSAKYKAALVRAAHKLCRVELQVVDVSADYDYGTFRLLKDDGMSAEPELRDAGDVRGYTRYLKESFAINRVKKKGLRDGKLDVGDRITVVGIGHVVASIPWGATNPAHGMPRGDDRYIMLRAFGRPSEATGDYEFAFMVCNWYIAAQ